MPHTGDKASPRSTAKVGGGGVFLQEWDVHRNMLCSSDGPYSRPAAALWSACFHDLHPGQAHRGRLLAPRTRLTLYPKPPIFSQVLNESPNAAMALDLIKQQEITKAAEHHKQEAEYAAYVKQMEVRRNARACKSLRVLHPPARFCRSNIFWALSVC